jgi:hypothetical protein
MLALCLAALLTGQTADTVTSLRLSGPQWREVNPLVPTHPAGLVALKAGLTTTLAVSGWKMRHQHPRLAAVLFIAGAASGTVGAVHNARLIHVR